MTAGQGLPFYKGHGTENDFVLIPDAAGVIELSPAQVRAISDRRAGLGGDGVIIVKPAPEQIAAGGARFFMDYRNADGSLAEMCGNGARLFARLLVDLGLERPGRFDFLTRGGVRTAELGGAGDVTVHMGPVRVGRSSTATIGAQEFKGIGVDVGNPHLACLTDAELSALDLKTAPGFDPETFPAGVNIEFVRQVGAGQVQMRVFERGVGETRSCGTGTVAAAVAYLQDQGRSSGAVDVHVLGGRVTVTVMDPTPADSADPAVFGLATLTGPAVVVASGVIDPRLIDIRGDAANSEPSR